MSSIVYLARKGFKAVKDALTTLTRFVFPTDTLVIDEAPNKKTLGYLTSALSKITKVELKGAYKPQYETLCHAIWSGRTKVTHFKCSIEKEEIEFARWTQMLHFVARMGLSTVKTIEICGEGWNVVILYVLLLKAPIYKHFIIESHILAGCSTVFRKSVNDELEYRRFIRVITDFIFACESTRSVKEPFIGFPVCLVRYFRGFLITSRPPPIMHVYPDLLDMCSERV
jgi:hypothetical protein